MRFFDFSSWQSIGTTLLGLALVTLIGVGIRLVVMMTIQQRRERTNRQINERLKTLMAAYKVLGGSFTGNLEVDPRHLRDIKRAPVDQAEAAIDLSAAASDEGGESDRPRRIRDAVEAALSDIILLGSEEHVRLAARAARELADGRPVHVHDLVIALRDFVRQSLDLAAVPADIMIPLQGPTRPSSSGGRGGASRSGERGGGRGGGGGGGGGMGMAGGMAGGMGLAGGASLAQGAASDEVAASPDTPTTT